MQFYTTFYFRSDLDELDKYFMKIAIDASTRSNDEFKVGACIVNDEKKIVGIGYNAMPNYLDDKFPFEKNKHNKLDCKLTYGKQMLIDV